MTTAAAPIKRKFPPPCWTQDEALALIEAYRERWYALRRGYLRTADWDSVAEAVGQRCPGASPAKTSSQCRHKMEKLRQRYRAEKQRSQSYPGRFFSSWFYFESMDAMENGSNPADGSNQQAQIDYNSVPLGFNLKNSKKIDGGFSNLNPNSGGGFRDKGVNDRNSVPMGIRLKNSSKIDGKFNPNFGNRVSNGYASYLDGGSDEEEEVDKSSQFGDGPSEFMAKKFGSSSGIRIKTQIDHQSMPPAFRARKFGKNEMQVDPESDSDDDGGYDDAIDGSFDGGDENWMKIPNSVGSRGKFSGKTDRSLNPSFDPRVSNGYSSQTRLDFERKNGSNGGVKRGRSPFEDMVSSIRLLGKGFMKMEKMKMDMAKEIEKMRMDMEMKRNELIIESQQQIVDAFVKGLFENKKKVKTTVSPDS